MNIAVRQFIVPTRRAVADKIAEPLNDWLWLISDVEDYSDEMGLAHWLIDDQPSESTHFIL